MPTLFQSQAAQAVPKSHMKPLAAFARAPDGIRFETQEEKETVELFLRQHPIVNVPWIFVTIVMILAPTILFPILSRIVPIQSLPYGYMIVGVSFWYLATFGYALSNFLHWFFNIYIVTDERLVDIDFLYLLYKRFSEAELTKIQDLSFTAGGLLATVFDFGSVNIETAGEAPNLIFEKVPHPKQIVETIRSLSEKENHEPL